MNIFDTCAWSLLMRRKPKSLSGKQKVFFHQLKDCLAESPIHIHECVRLEILSGIRDKEQFEKARHYLRFQPEVAMNIGVYEHAAELSNLCRSKGLNPGTIDVLLVSSAIEHHATIYTNDKDFAQMRKHIEFKLEGV